MSAAIESQVTCPVCKGHCGVTPLEPGDWHDCDFCDATGKVGASVAYRHIVGPSLWASDAVQPFGP